MEVFDEYNINTLPVELQYQILDQLSFSDLRKVYIAIEDERAKNYAKILVKRYIEGWSNTSAEDLAKKGDLDGIKWLTNQGTVFSDDEVIIINAAHSGNVELLDWLFSMYGVGYDDVTSDEIVHIAVKNGDLKLLRWVIALRSDIFAVIDEYYLSLVASSGNLELLKWLVQFDDDDIKNEKVLESARSSGNMEMVRWIIEYEPENLHKY